MWQKSHSKVYEVSARKPFGAYGQILTTGIGGMMILNTVN